VGKPLQQEWWERQRTLLEVLAQLHGDVEPDQQDGAPIYDRPLGSLRIADGD
jgi:hypothetical protein